LGDSEIEAGSEKFQSELPLVTVAIPVLNEERYIEACLLSLFAGSYPVDRLEVLVVDGGSDDRTVELVRRVKDTHPEVEVVPNPGRIQAVAMNIAIEMANGEIIVRLDAHSNYQPNHIERIVERLVAGDAENAGGVQFPIGTTLFGRLAASCLRTSFSMGGSVHRTAREPRYSESVFLGGWRIETLRGLGGFNPEWEVNEDYELNVRLRKSGGRVMVLPELVCDYVVRPTPFALAKQYYRYGVWRARTIRCHRSAFRLRHAAPVMLLMALVLSLVLYLTGSDLGLLVPAIYGVSLLAGTANVIFNSKNLTSLLASPVFVLIHVSWGAGLFVGALRSVLISKQRPK
jgi:succinoglycan biosynthesis protein ExoA